MLTVGRKVLPDIVGQHVGTCSSCECKTVFDAREFADFMGLGPFEAKSGTGIVCYVSRCRFCGWCVSIPPEVAPSKLPNDVIFASAADEAHARERSELCRRAVVNSVLHDMSAQKSEAHSNKILIGILATLGLVASVAFFFQNAPNESNLVFGLVVGFASVLYIANEVSWRLRSRRDVQPYVRRYLNFSGDSIEDLRALARREMIPERILREMRSVLK